MKMLEIDEKEFINLNKVLSVKIKDHRSLDMRGKANTEEAEFIANGYRLEFELENGSNVSSKRFETVENARMWLFEHTK